jgi:HSP20 family protein
VRGEKSVERTEGEDERRYHVWERRYGSFARSFTLPRAVRSDAIEAKVEDGVLTIRMPKAPDAKTRKIPIAGAPTAQPEVGSN